jgi:hypothetical protein
MKTKTLLSCVLNQKKDNIIIYLLMLLAFLIPLPFKENITSIVLILILGVSLGFNFKETFNIKRLKNDMFFVTNVSIYLLFVIGLIYANDFSRGIRLLQKMLPFLIFPLILSNISFSHRVFKSLFKSVILGVIVYTIILWFSIYEIYLSNEILNQKIGFNFTLHSFIRKTPISVHHAYVGMYCTLAIVFLIYLLEETKKINSKLCYIGLIIYLLLNFSLMAGKISFLLLFVSIFLYVGVRRKQKKKTILLTFVLSAAFLPILFLDINWIKLLLLSSIEDRFKIFKTAYIASLENLPFGVGTSDIKNVLESYYIRFDFEEQLGLGTHNTFLSFVLRFGFLGVIVYVGYFFYSIKIASKTKNIFSLILLTILFLSSLTEHVFETHRGRFFFMFFLCFLHYGYQRINIQKIDNWNENSRD